LNYKSRYYNISPQVLDLIQKHSKNENLKLKFHNNQLKNEGELLNYNTAILLRSQYIITYVLHRIRFKPNSMCGGKNKAHFSF
jgi:hypothetical protein